ncbi:MAG: TonB-dependent receptor [Steroidobacteraceae bacterium]
MHSNRYSTVSRTIAIILATAAGSALTGQVALAQQSAAAPVEEIVITTARQREEALQDVPASVTALTASTLEAASVERAGDLVRLTPGVSLVQTAEVADAQVNIRGINGARDAENSFALIIDGILMTNPAAFNREYADLKQVEIVKGPQGAIYGRNAAAGAIIVTTTTPGVDFGGDFRASYGEDNTYTGQFVLGGPMSNRSGWKLTGDYRSTDGFYGNKFLGAKNVDDFEGWNLNGRMLFELGDSGKLDVKAHYGKVDAASISFNANFLVPGLVFSGLPNAELFNEDANDHNFDFVNNIDPFNKQEAIDVSVKWDQDLSFGKLTAWALYSDIQNSLGSDGTSASYGFFNNDPVCQSTAASVFNSGFALPPPQILFFGANGVPPAAVFGPYGPTACDGTQYQERNQTDYSAEIRLSSSGDTRLRWLGGLYFLNIDREVGVNTGIDLGQGIVESLYAPPGSANPTEQVVWDNFKSDVYAAFGNLAFDVSDTLELAVALRYDREERKVHNLVPTAARTQYFDFDPFDGPGNTNIFTGMAPLNAALNPAINPSGVIADRDLTFSQLQPKVSLSWQVNPQFTTYANWGVGFKSGGFNNSGSAATVDLFINCFTGRGPNGETNLDVGACGAGTANVPQFRSVVTKDDFQKEKSSAFELGAKGTMADGRVQFEAAIYDTKVDNMQFFEFLVGQFGLLRVVNNIDEVKLRGAEIGLSAKITDDLRLVGGYNRTMSEIKVNNSRPNSVGNESPYTPDYTATAGVELDAPVSDGGWRLQASAYWNLVGPTWFHVIQAQDNETVAFGTGNYTNGERDKYSTLDARVAVRNDNLTVAVVAKNLTDTKFLQEVIPAPEFGGAFIHPGSERRLSVEVGYKF